MRTLGDGLLRVRTAVPGPLMWAGQHAYSRVTTLTAPLRLKPGFVMIGAQRCGTTSLFRALMDHPQVVAPTFHKGINYFDLNYYRGMRWYKGHFPVVEIARLRAARYGAPLAFEASGYYMYHPFALERLTRDLPGVKLIVMLRDPVERAYSAYKHESARGFEHESFERALQLEDDRLSGEIDRMRDDFTYESISHRHHSYRHRGHYAEQLERAFALVPRSQVYVIDSGEFFSQPAREYARLIEFLGLRPFEPAFPKRNARPGGPMVEQTRQWLQEYFAPHNERLVALLGRPPSWAC